MLQKQVRCALSQWWPVYYCVLPVGLFLKKQKLWARCTERGLTEDRLTKGEVFKK